MWLFFVFVLVDDDENDRINCFAPAHGLTRRIERGAIQIMVGKSLHVLTLQQATSRTVPAVEIQRFYKQTRVNIKRLGSSSLVLYRKINASTLLTISY